MALQDVKGGFEILDFNGHEIQVGSVCVYGCPEPHERNTARYLVTVEEITDPDGDYDDELGRGVAINPYVKVRFHDGDEDQIGTSFNWNKSGMYGDPLVYDCDDLELYDGTRWIKAFLRFHTSDSHDWESCAACVQQAKHEGILGPDARPFVRTDGPDHGDFGGLIGQGAY